jgi:broad specificity phosphatase PhoE
MILEGRPRTRGGAVVLALAAIALCALPARARAQTTVVMLVRHAEQEAGQDPGLNAAGRARADSLVAVARRAGVAAIYHTQYRRTRETAKPAADSLGIGMIELGPQQGQAVTDHAAEVARRILEEHGGRTVLVVGHSNTVPLIAAALGVTEPPRIVETEYGHLFIVVNRKGEPARLIHARYGS